MTRVHGSTDTETRAPWQNGAAAAAEAANGDDDLRRWCVYYVGVQRSADHADRGDPSFATSSAEV